MKKGRILCIISMVLLINGLPVFGQQQASQPPQYRDEPAHVTVHEISRHVYEVRGGSGANSSFIIGDKEVYVLDAKMDNQSAKEVINAVKKITDKPISHIILTHSDGDHVNGLTGFSSDLDIIAHENSAKHIKKANESEAEKLPLPNKTFYHRMNIYSGNLEIYLFYFGSAHTDGDIVVFIPDDNVAIIGDLFFKDRDPLIHMHKNGSSFGLTKVLKEIIDLDANIYLSGHAEPVVKADIENLRQTIMEKQDTVRTMIEDNKSLNEIKEAYGVALDESRWRSLIEVIYLELIGEK